MIKQDPSTFTVIVLFSLLVISLSGCERPPPVSEQQGFRGTGMVEVVNPRIEAQQIAANEVPVSPPAAAAAGPKAGDTYKNVQILGDLSVVEFTQLMTSITAWVAPPEQSCNYCHNPADLSSDDIYAKIVARRMIEMTQAINAGWKDHVADTGVTCYTCHRGQPVPAEIWFTGGQPVPETRGMAGRRKSQNLANETVGDSSLPGDPFTSRLLKSERIRVATTTALPTGEQLPMEQTELTYGLMMHMSESLGVNCTYCHNSRAWADWSQSRPVRTKAWHGIQMVQNLNSDYLNPLQSTYPENRLGPMGDAPKLNCATCHQGVAKPLLGKSMLDAAPALAKPAE